MATVGGVATAGGTADAVTMAELTTLRVGGPVAEFVEPASVKELAAVVARVQDAGHDYLVMGGGSNLLVRDEGFDGVVIRLANRGVSAQPQAGGSVLVRVGAGEDWDAVVAQTVAHGLGGIEALSGIPGRAGAAPVQNIGAYGQELSDVLVAVELLDPISGEIRRVAASELELGYRTSALKQGDPRIVTSLDLRLQPADEAGGQVRYQQLADALGLGLGDHAPLERLRDAVLRLRARKGMVLDPADPDTVSAGSFFTNPIVSQGFAAGLPKEVPRWSLAPAQQDIVVALDGGHGAAAALAEVDAASRARAARQAAAPQLVKLSAAWLIEHSGIQRGYSLPGSRAAISSKHTLAITNRGESNAFEIATLARLVRARVQSEFGVLLAPEPRLVGVVL